MKKKTGMPGLVSLDEMMAALPEEQRKRIEARGAELVAKIRRRMTLAELRKGQKISQAAVAEALGIGQMQISRLEQRKDPRLSTMQRTVAAMGGHLTMIATFPDQEPVILVTSPPTERKSAAKSRGAATSRMAASPQRKVRARA